MMNFQFFFFEIHLDLIIFIFLFLTWAWIVLDLFSARAWWMQTSLPYVKVLSVLAGASWGYQSPQTLLWKLRKLSRVVNLRFLVDSGNLVSPASRKKIWYLLFSALFNLLLFMLRFLVCVFPQLYGQFIIHKWTLSCEQFSVPSSYAYAFSRHYKGSDVSLLLMECVRGNGWTHSPKF